MIRGILFRGKRLDNGEWIVGHLLRLGKYSFSDPERFGIINEAIPVGLGGIAFNMKIDEVYPDTVGQYTGLTDKNGKKIFEGDLVKTKYGRECIVGWLHGKAMFDLDPRQNANNAKTKAPDDYDLWCSQNLEVVGNVYDTFGL